MPAGAVVRLRDRLGEFVFEKVAGPDGPRDRESIHGTRGPRWFDPGSPITRVHGDAAMFVGGIRAVVLQSLHPAAMKGVSDHSGYRGDLWGRLARTSKFIAVTTFGTVDQAEAAIGRVRRIHEHVTGRLHDGTPYAASDPHLLSWVHAAEIDSFLCAYQRYGRHALTRSERDEYVAQAGEVARRLGVLDPPSDEQGLRRTLDAFRPELRGTAEAREAVGLLWQPPLPAAARPGYAMLRTAAVDLLPGWAQQELGLGGSRLRAGLVAPALGTVSTRAVRWALTSPASAGPGSGRAGRWRSRTWRTSGP